MMFRMSTMVISGQFKYFLVGVLWLMLPIFGGQYHVEGLYDLDNDGVREVLVLQSVEPMVMLIEVTSTSISDTLWSYTLPDGRQFTDIAVVDINGNGQPDLVATARLQPENGDQGWLFVFPGTNTGFKDNPFIAGKKGLNINNLRPINLSRVEGAPGYLSVSFGTPVRKTLVIHPEITDAGLSVDKGQILSDPLIQNGFGHMYSGTFSSGGRHYLAQFSTELNTLKVSVFDVDKDYQTVTTEVLQLGDARGVIAQEIQAYKNPRTQASGLLIPFTTGEVKILKIDENTLMLSDSDFSGSDLFPVLVDPSESELVDLVNSRVQSGFYHVILTPADYLKEAREAKAIPRPKTGSGPTLVDYLNEAGVKNKPVSSQRIEIPDVSDGMRSADWVEEAGIDIEQIESSLITEETEESSKIVAVPDKDDEILAFSETVQEALAPTPVEETQLDEPKNGDSQIELYYVLVMTPATETKDRFIFDGEAPFGVAVNQVPPMGEPTHFQHSVSASLTHLRRGNEYDFAYTLKENVADNVTTLTMVHDMQTKIVFSSISPADDPLSQSYQPEAFDPKLFEFPDYFFEGFPASLGMDFTDNLIRFSFNDQSDTSVYQGIYLSATTPSKPAQSLAVFLDEGTLQAIRGEVKVRENGSKKITTEFDIAGFVEPAVMFSRLIQGNFPDSLKTLLLQGESLEEPLFGPDGKLPRVIHERRLPDAQFGQQNPLIPVEPLQGIFPEGQGVTTQSAAPAESPTPQPQEASEGPSSPETPASQPQEESDEPTSPESTTSEPSTNDTSSDSLNLENPKAIPSDRNRTQQPEESQLESNHPNDTDTPPDPEENN